MVFLNGQFFIDSLVFRADDMRILAVDDAILLMIKEKGWNLTFSNIFKFDRKRIMLKLWAIFLGHLQCKWDDELWRLYILACYFESYHLKRVERGVDNLKQDICRFVIDAVEECGGGTHGAAPEDESFKLHQP